MKTTKQRAADYFKSNPGTAELFGTSDGTLFLERQHAVGHAKTLEEKEVENFLPSDAKITKRLVTQEDLDLNPDLVAEGVKVGDEIEFEAVKPEEIKKAAAPKTPKAPAAPKVKAAPKTAKAKAEPKAKEVKTAAKADVKPVTENTPPAV